MASALDLIRARDAAPAADAELVGPPEPPPQKTSVLDLVRARDAAPPPEPAPKSGSAGGALIGGMARTEKERAETPEFIRRPEEPTPESPPQPDEPPPLLKRRYDEPAPPGAYGKPTRLERAVLTGARIGLPIAAGIGAGALSGPGAPVVGPLVGASVGTATELGAEKYEKGRGFRKEVSPYGVMWTGALNAIPGIPLAEGLSVPARIGARMLEGSTIGTVGTTGGTLLEEGRWPTTEELLWAAGMGAAFGAGGGTFEAKGVPYLHERSPEFVGPREGGVFSRRQLRAADAARVTDTGETVLPPVGEPGPGLRVEPDEQFVGPAPPQRLVPTEPGEPIGPPAPEPGAVPPPPSPERVTPVHTYETVTGMSADDLEAAHANQRAYEQSAAVDVFGPEQAKRYEQLQRTANSTIAPHETTRAASDEIARMEAGLSPAQEARLFGFGEQGYNADELRRIARAARDYDPANVADMPDADLLNTAGRELLSGNLKDDPVATIRLHGALRELGNRGYEKSVIRDAVTQRAAREGVEPADAQFLFESNLRDLQTRQTPPEPTQGALPRAQQALPAPEPIGPPEPPAFVGPPEPPGPPGAEPPPPPEGPPPGGEYAGPTPPPEEPGPYGQRGPFRRYPGLGEALTGEEIGPQLGADPERMTRAIESVDREFGDVLDEPSRDRLKQQIRDNQARFEYLGRGKQTVERTQGLGRDLLFDLDKAKLEPKGTVWNAEQTASAKNHIASLDQGIVAAQEAFDAEPTPQNGLLLQKAVQDQIDAFNIYRARGAEAGRTVNIYKASAEELASGNQRLMMAALRRGVPPDKLAEIIRSTSPKNIMQRAEMLMAVSERGPWHRQLRDTLQTIWISNILSGPPPHQRNILGNAVNALLTPAAKPFATFHERFLARVPDAERTVRLGEVGKHFVGLWDATPDAIYKAFEVLKQGYTQEQAATYDLPRHELGIGRHPALRAGLNIVPRALGGMDMFFRVIGQEASLNSQAYTKARNQALVEQAGHALPQGTSFAERLDSLYNYHRDNLTPDMMTQAADEASRGVYQERDTVARTLQFIRDQIPGGGFIAPFITTSTNIAKQGLHWSPVGYAMPSTRGKGVTLRMQTLHHGEALAGTTGMLLGPLALWAAGGKLHGSGPDDPDQFAIWRQTHVPNSIEIGGTQVGFNQMGPLAIPMGIVGNAWDRYDAIEKKNGFVTPQDAQEIAAAAIGGAAETVLDQPYMQGISNLVDVMRHPKELRYWSRFSKDIATGFVPGAGMLRYIEQIKDPTVREGKTIPEKLQAGIPGMSASLPPKLDEFGQPITIKKVGGAWGRALLPIDVERVRRDPLREELAQQSLTLSAPGPGTPLKGEPPYTPQESLAIRQAKGQQLRAELEDLIASDAYKEAEPDERMTMLKSVIGKTRGEIGKAARGLRDEGLDVQSLRW